MKNKQQVYFSFQNLKSIILSQTLTTLGEYFCSSCDSLETINIPESITEISDYAFSSCDSLKSVQLHLVR